MASLAKAARAADSVPASTGRIRSILGTSTKAVKGAGDKAALSTSHVRQLAFSPDPADRQILRDAVQGMTPGEKINFYNRLTMEFRDPQTSIDAPGLTPEGQLIESIVFDGAEPDAAKLEAIRQSGDVGGIDGVDLSNVADDTPKPPPTRRIPDSKVKEVAPSGQKIKQPADDPRFHVKQKAVTKDGNTTIENTSSSLPRQDAAAIASAKRGGKPSPVGDAAARAGETAPEDNYARALTRVLKIVNPSVVPDGRRAVSNAALGSLDAAIPPTAGGVPGSALPGTSGKPGKANSIARRSAGDMSDLEYLMKERGITDPNAFSSPRELAEVLVSGGPQGMFDATPITRGDRVAAEDALFDAYPDAVDLPPGMPENLRLTPSEAGAAVRQQAPDVSQKATVAGRQGSVQEQAVQELTRQLDEFYGSSGWGDQYVAPAGVSDIPSAPHIEAAELGGPRRTTEGRPSGFAPRQGPEPQPRPAPPKAEPVGASTEPAGDLAGSNDALQAERNARRQAVIDQIQPNFPDREFTLRSTQEIDADLEQLLPSDPERRALEIERRNASFLESYMRREPSPGTGEVYQRPDYAKRGKKGSRKPQEKPAPEKAPDNPADLNDESLDNAATELGDAPSNRKQPLDNDGTALDDAKKADPAKDGANEPGHFRRHYKKYLLGGAAVLGLPLASVIKESARTPADGPNRIAGTGPEPSSDLSPEDEAAFAAVMGNTGARPVVRSSEDRLRALQRIQHMGINPNTQRIGSWRE